jgi:amino acid permease
MLFLLFFSISYCKISYEMNFKAQQGRKDKIPFKGLQKKWYRGITVQKLSKHIFTTNGK